MFMNTLASDAIFNTSPKNNFGTKNACFYQERDSKLLFVS